jgi:hypothetical protein
MQMGRTICLACGFQVQGLMENESTEVFVPSVYSRYAHNP